MSSSVSIGDALYAEKIKKHLFDFDMMCREGRADISAAGAKTVDAAK